MVPHHPDSLCYFAIVRRHRAGLAARTEVLPRVEAERPCAADRAGPPPSVLPTRKVLRAVRLASILDHDQVISLCDLLKGIHVRWLAIEVNGDDRGDEPASLLVKPLTGSGVAPALRLEILVESRRIHVVGALVDVDEVRHCAGLGD